MSFIPQTIMMLGEAKLLCEKYELDWDVTEEYMQPEMIRDKVGFIGMEEVWNESAGTIDGRMLAVWRVGWSWLECLLATVTRRSSESIYGAPP